MANQIEVANLILPGRRNVLKAGLLGALGAGVVGQAAPPKALESEVVAQAPEQGQRKSQPAAPDKKPLTTGTTICPFTMMGTGFVNGGMVYYYTCFDCPDQMTMTLSPFSTIVPTGCNAGEPPCTSKGDGGPRGQKSTAKVAVGCDGFLLTDTDLSTKGVWAGAKAVDAPEFEFLGRFVQKSTPFDFKFKDNGGSTIVATACYLKPIHYVLKGKFPEKIGIGLQYQGDPDEAITPVDNGVGPKMVTPYYYIVQHNNTCYHVILGK
jgi:hypothetical protein